MKKQLTTAIFAFAFLGITQNLSAQLVDSDNANQEVYSAQDFFPLAEGKPFSDIRYIEAHGSAFFDFKWEMGTVIDMYGKSYKEVPIRIDLVTNKIHYKTEDGRELVVGTSLREVKFESQNKTIHFLHGNVLPNKKTGWYQLLVNDSVSLLKSFKKTIEERVSYGGNHYYINTSETYILYFNNTEYSIKKPSDFIAVLPGKKAEIEAEIKRTKSQSKEEQLMSLTTFVNGLVEG